MNLRELTSMSSRDLHRRLRSERMALRESMRCEVLAETRDAIHRLVPEHPEIRTVFLFGSLLRPGHFGPNSDIDLAVECERLEAETPFARALEQELRRPVDLRPLAGGLAESIREEGERLHG